MSEIAVDVALKAALAAASAAGTSLLADFERNRAQHGRALESWMKSPGALVTEADIAADATIAESLRSSGIGAALLSEESSSGDAGGDAVWLVDPLCGTVPFRSGMPHWGVSIAFRQGARLVAGVVALPESGRVIAAGAGSGVLLNGERYEGHDPLLPLHEAVIGLEVDGGAEWARLLRPNENGHPELRWPGSVSQTNTFASAAYPLAVVCAGGMSGVVFYTIDSVHLAAGALIAQELGAIVSDRRGNALDWRGGEPHEVAVVAWPSVHADLIEALSGSQRNRRTRFSRGCSVDHGPLTCRGGKSARDGSRIENGGNPLATRVDLKKDFPDYYKATRKPMRVVLRPAPFITFDGVGAPESDAFKEAVGALFAVAYTLKFSCKYAGNDFAVPALEAFWWAGQREVMTADASAISSIPREEWRWKAMIRVPDFVTESLFKDAQAHALEKKQLESINRVRFETIEEGPSVQIMHVGPYSTEPQSIKHLLEFMEANGLAHAERKGIGPHHEIYLSDPGRTAPENLRTLIRIPVEDAD